MSRDEMSGKVPGRGGESTRSELPTDPAYWAYLGDRVEAASLPELRAALEQARERQSSSWLALGWLDGLAPVGRWAVPAAALALAWLWISSVSAPTAPHANRSTVATESAAVAEAAAATWREALVPERSLAEVLASSSPPSVVDLLPWTPGLAPVEHRERDSNEP